MKFLNKIYRNIFEKGDNVQAFVMKRIEDEMGLNRDKLIYLALFLGSDYTLGIKGIALEFKY